MQIFAINLWVEFCSVLQVALSGKVANMKVLISPVVLPEFRVDLYNRLNNDFELEVVVAHGTSNMPVFTGKMEKKFSEIVLVNKEFHFCGFSFVWQKGLIKEVLFGSYDVFLPQGNFGILSNYPILLIRWLRGKKNIVWMCAYERPEVSFGIKKKIRNKVSGMVLKLFHGSVAYSSHAKEYLVSRGMPAECIRVIGNTVDVKSLHEKSSMLQRQVCQEALGLKGDVILFVGKLTAAKKIELLLYALKELIDSGRDDVMLVLLGDGPVRGGLEVLSRDLGLNDHVRFEGVVIDGKEKYFRVATVAVMPGSGGLFINDCMASGLPVILSYSDGTHFDLIEDNVTGVLFERDNEKDLAKKISMLLDDESLRNRIASRAEELILEKYTIDKMAENFNQALMEL